MVCESDVRLQFHSEGVDWSELLLIADADAQPRYQRLGFTSYSDVMAVTDKNRLFNPA